MTMARETNMEGGFGILLVFASILGGLGINGVNESNVKEYIDKDCESIADFIENNFDRFVDEYNKYAKESDSGIGELWNAKYIEDRFTITINDCGAQCDGVFLDFDSDNGYAVVGDDYNLLDMSISGESPYEGIASDEYAYSASSGYLYLSGGDYLSVNKDNNGSDELLGRACSSSYEGQDVGASGCGRINDPGAYIKSRYGDGYRVSSERSLNMKAYHQSTLSCVTTDGGCSEENCWVVSAYHALQYLADTRWSGSGMPKSTSWESYDYKGNEPSTYDRHYDDNGRAKSSSLDKKTYSGGEFPALYCEARRFAYSNFGAVEDGGNIGESSGIIEGVAAKYGLSVNGVEHIRWGSFADKGTNYLDNDVPLLWSTSNDTYGSHTMAVCGYKYYKKTCSWWFFTWEMTKLLYEVKDGWTNNGESKYYDLSGHVGFSAIVSLEF